MSKQSINIGTFPNDGTGDSIRTGMDKVNTNFTEIYDALGDGEDIRDISVSTSLASGGGSLTYSNRTLNYTPPNLSAYLTSLGSIGEHSDVSISNPELNEVLKWDGSSWVNGVLDIASTDYVDNAVTGLATTEYVDTAVSGVTTFSGNYTDLTNKPTIPLNINDLSDVNAGSPSTGQVLKWSGTEWNASSDLAGDGGTGIGLSDISLTVNSAGVSSLAYNNTTGVFTFTPTSLTGLATTEYVDNAVTGLATTEYVDNAVTRSRSFATSSTDPIGVGSTATIRIVNTPRTYVLYSIQTEYPAWVTLYTDTNSRTNDASRNETTDPLPGSGVIAEVITTTNNLTQLITPGTIGFNNQPTPHPEIYLRVVNKHDSEVSIAVTVKYLKLED